MTALGGFLIVVGVGIGVVFGIVLLIKAFQTSVLWGLAYLFVPFAALAYVITHWEEARKPFLRGLIGIPLALIGAVLAGSQADPSDFSIESSGGGATITFSSDDSERRPSDGGGAAARRPAATEPPRAEQPVRREPEPAPSNRRSVDFSAESETRFRGVNLWDMEELVRDYPEDVGARYELAARQASFGRWDQAVENLEKAAGLFSQAPENESNSSGLHSEILTDDRFRALLAERPDFKQSLRETQEGITIDLAP